MRLRHALVLAGLAAIAFAVRLDLLLQTPHPTGLDGYYYVVQLDDYARLGLLHVPDGSWVLRFLGLVARVLGDPILAHKAGASALAAACIPAAWWLGQRHSPALAWALSIWAGSSPTLTHLAGDFAKNLGALAPGLAFAAAWQLRGPARWPVLLATGLLTATAHRLGAAFLLVGLLGSGLGLVLRRGPSLPPRTAIIGILATGILFATASAALPGLLHPADLERLSGQLSLGLGAPSPLPWLSLRHTEPVQAVELCLPWLALGLAAWRAVVAPEDRPAALAALACLGLVLVVPWRRDVLDLGYRLALMGPVLAVLAVATLLPGRLPLPSMRIPTKDPGPLELEGRLLVFALLMALSRTGLDPAAHPDYDAFDGLIEAIPRPLPELLVAHQGINFLYDHGTGAEAMAWAPEPELDPRSVGRVVWGATPAEWRALAPEEAPLVELGPDYLFAREDQWRAFLEAVAAEGDDDLRERVADPRNPSRVRPASLTRNR